MNANATASGLRIRGPYTNNKLLLIRDTQADITFMQDGPKTGLL